MSGFSNYYLQARSAYDIIHFCEKLYSQYIRLKNKVHVTEKINIAIANECYMFNESNIIPYVSRFLVNYISAFKINSVESNKFIVLSPCLSTKEFLKKLELDRVFRLTLITDKLFDNDLYFDINKLFNSKQPQYIDSHDICKYIQEEIVNNKNYNRKVKEYKTISSIYEHIVKPLYDAIPLNLYSTSYLLNQCKDDSVILINPDKSNLHLFDTYNNLVGIIQNLNTPLNTIEYIKNKDLLIFPGTGEII